MAMEILLTSIGVVAALGIAWSDFRIREIHIGWFAIMAIAGIMYQISYGTVNHMNDMLFNGLCIGFMVGSIWLIYRMKGEAKIMDKLLGWGDVVMLIVLGIWLSPLSFLLLFTTTSLILSVGILILQRRGRISQQYPIPLAGTLAVAFIPICLFLI